MRVKSAILDSSQPSGSRGSGKRATINISGQSLARSESGEFEQGIPQVSPDFFGDEGREGMQQSQGNIKHARQRFHCLFFGLSRLHLFLGDFHIPIGKVRPEEFVNFLTSLSVLEVLELPLHVADEGLEFCPDPTVSESPTLSPRPLSHFGRGEPKAG